ncbi:discoidin domain-containing protein [Paenibacillus sp. LK1]|uniref:discoidin domain-containing protein n=1 Tax=Paenibacillus sp. LK1 TaxID=2053014 RepID=UPI000C1839A2|nr:discoidin domain-containing protein [Paenibacillus sp. LK1]PIH59770.1 hypothetical protein CS562_07475 [Paenibacillus sp. LK1]
MGYISTENAIPIMTSATAPSGIASASSEYNPSSTEAWRAFNRNTSTYFATNNTTSGWLSYEFPSPKTISKYRLTAWTATGMPKAWTFEGSNDGTNWTVLDTRSSITTWTTSNEFEISSPKLLKIYRLNMTSNNGYARIAIGMMEMFELLYYDKFLISSGDHLYSIGKLTMKASASTIANINFTAENAISGFILTDNTNGSRWSSALNDTKAWFMIEFPYAIEINKVKFLQYRLNYNNNVIPRIKDCELSFSDGSTFQTTLSDASVDYNKVPTESDWSSVQFPSKKTSFVKIQRLSAYAGNVDYVSFIEFEVYSNNLKVTHNLFDRVNILPNKTEDIFIRFGMNKAKLIDLENETVFKNYVNQTSQLLGTGKVFKQKIDTAKIPIKKASIT